MTTTNTTEKQRETMAKIMGKAIAKVAQTDPELARKMSDAICAVTAKEWYGR